jgi:hypothetical protein
VLISARQTENFIIHRLLGRKLTNAFLSSGKLLAIEGALLWIPLTNDEGKDQTVFIQFNYFPNETQKYFYEKLSTYSSKKANET